MSNLQSLRFLESSGKALNTWANVIYEFESWSRSTCHEIIGSLFQKSLHNQSFAQFSLSHYELIRYGQFVRVSLNFKDFLFETWILFNILKCYMLRFYRGISWNLNSSMLGFLIIVLIFNNHYYIIYARFNIIIKRLICTQLGG